MSTVRDRFGVSILVGLVLAVALSSARVGAAAHSGHANGGAPGTRGSETANIEAGFGVVGLDSAVSNGTHVAVALGAGVPLLLFAFMVKRRIQADN